MEHKYVKINDGFFDKCIGEYGDGLAFYISDKELFVTGNLTEKRFKVLSDSYEREQEELETLITQEQAKLDTFNADTDRAG